MNGSSTEEINKETEDLNDTLDQMALDIYRTCFIYRTFQSYIEHSKAAEYILFSSAHGTFLRIYHILGHKSSLSKFKKIEIVSSSFSNHNAIRLEINYNKKKTCKKHKHMET